MSEAFEKIKRAEEKLLCRTYSRYPVAITRGAGSRLWDVDGKEYVDLLAGIAVEGLGHCNPELCEVLEIQARKLWNISNLFYQEEQLDLAKILLSTSHHDKAFFCNSGAEANEAAIKIARRYQQRVKNTERYEIITFSHAFHGRTLATLAATGQEKYLDGFSPRTDGFVQVAWHDIEALKKAVTDKTAAVLIEIIQGEGGVNCLSPEYVEQVQELCRKNGILFMVDEVQAGLCRSGKWWAFQHYDVRPDVITNAKALANGLPLGCMMTTDEIAKAFVPGSHATTFGGGALVTKAGAKVLEIMERDKLAERAEHLGNYLETNIMALKSPWIKEVRGFGLLRGIQLTCSEESAKTLWNSLIEEGIVINLTQGTVLRLLPALTISEQELGHFIQILDKLLKRIEK